MCTEATCSGEYWTFVLPTWYWKLKLAKIGEIVTFKSPMLMPYATSLNNIYTMWKRHTPARAIPKWSQGTHDKTDYVLEWLDTWTFRTTTCTQASLISEDSRFWSRTLPSRSLCIVHVHQPSQSCNKLLRNRAPLTWNASGVLVSTRVYLISFLASELR